ncbi:MAG: hypothetical protein V7642_1853 [Burkholderiales bacterium]|jgi:hypothetical protein
MDVEVIYRQPDGSRVMLGTRDLSGLPPMGKRFHLDHREYIAKEFDGPDAAGHYRLYLEDEPPARTH